MDSMELSKIGGAACAALLVFMLANWASENVYHMDAPAQAAFAVEIEEVEATGGGDDGGVPLGALLVAADAGSGEKVFKKCKACHKLEDGANGVGPHLWGVVDRDIAGVGGYAYSSALGDLEGGWTFEALDAFLEKPKAYAPGTKMSFAGLSKPEDRAALIVYLNDLDGSPTPLPE